MENLESRIHQLKGKGEFINEDIDKQVGVVYDELKSYIEGLTCCDKIHHNILIREARFEYAIAKLKNLVWEKLRIKNTDTPPKKQAKIIFYSTDQSTTCFIEDENGRITTNNPYGLGLSCAEYKKLLEKDGYEWVMISHNGSYGSEVWDKSNGYVFKGKYANLKVGDKYYDGYNTIHIKK